MWFLGLIAGFVFGALVGGWSGAIAGAVLGAIGVYALQHALAPARRELQSLKDEVARQRLELDQALRRINALETSRVPGPATQALEPAPEARVHAPFEAAAPEAAAPAAPPRAAAAPTSTPARAPRPAVAASPAASPLAPLARWFLGGNTLVRVGVVVLFFGLAFLLKFAYEHTHVPIELRLTGVALAALAMLAVGWRLRERRPGYALALQGGGVAALYLTVFAALRLFALLPPGAALVLMLAIVALSAALAVLQNAQSLAILGAGGGFLAPILASTGAGSHVMLFSYYAALNAGILAVAWFKAWRPLNLVGFVFTFAIGTLWGNRAYRPELFASTEPFLVLFFLMYLAVPVLFARRAAMSQMERYVDATLIFGVPLVAFALQLRLVREIEFGAAFSAAAVSLVYLIVARLLSARHRDTLRMLLEAFVALGVVFGTLAIPLAVDGRWTAAAWALEGAAIAWAGVRQRRLLARAGGMLLQLGAGIAFLAAWNQQFAAVAVFNSFWLGCVLVSGAGLFTSWYLERHAASLTPGEPGVARLLFFWGLAWWLFAGLHEIHAHTPERFHSNAALIFVAGSSIAFSLLHRALAWRPAIYPALALLPAAGVILFADAAVYLLAHPVSALGWIAWPFALAVHLWLLRRYEQDRLPALAYWHAAAMWLVAVLAAWELEWLIRKAVDPQTAWPLVAWALVPAGLLALLALRGDRLGWPIRGQLAAYVLMGGAPLAGFLWCWILFASFASDGNAAPLPFVPVLNPLDLAAIGALLAIGLWFRQTLRLGLADFGARGPIGFYVALGAAAFVAANAALLRALHHFADVPFALEPMWHSMLVQAALSIFWTVLALAAMVTATRLRMRPLWLAGAALMGVVVIKLFLVDLSRVGGIERIVSFTGVGLLMLLIGYLSPVPPRTHGTPK